MCQLYISRGIMNKTILEPISGAARGCGWQTLCAVINLGAYYVVGIPSAVLLAFMFHVGGMGLWMGIICGLSVQAVALVVVNVATNWDDEVMKAIDQIQATRHLNDNRIRLFTTY